MNDLDADLKHMEGWIGGILSGLSLASRTRATRQISGLLRTGQARRIAAQRNPDGSAFAPRKKPKASKTAKSTKKFLYPTGGSGAARVVVMKSWTARGNLFTGLDVMRGEIRSFDKAKIIKWLPVSNLEQNKGARAPRAKSPIKLRIMFAKLRTSRHLRSGSSAQEAWVGFGNDAAGIAGVHQRGERDRPSARQAPVKYERRALLGLTDAEEQQILDMLVHMVADGG